MSTYRAGIVVIDDETASKDIVMESCAFRNIRRHWIRSYVSRLVDNFGEANVMFKEFKKNPLLFTLGFVIGMVLLGPPMLTMLGIQ